MKVRLAIFALTLLAALPAVAQDISLDADFDEAIASQVFMAPRHLFVTEDQIYVVEAGQGGETPAESPFGISMIGATGKVTAINTAGEATPFITGLFSSMTETAEVTGPHAFYRNDEAAWVLVGQGVATAPDETPDWALLQYSADGTTLENTIEFLSYEETNNPDSSNIDSNPIDFVVADDGAIYVADAGANAIFKVVEGEISTFAVWSVPEGEPQAVPTAIELDAEGNMYVGFLTGFPFPTGAAWIEVLDPTGASIRRYDGLTMVVDIDITEEALYAVEFSQFTEEGPVPGSGRIVRVSEEGIEDVVTGPLFPYGMAALDDGSFLVVNGSSFAPVAKLLHVNDGDVTEVPDMPAPALPVDNATEEATPETEATATEEAE